MTTSLTAQIDDALPQTQCTRCGYADCHAYAEAIAEEHVPINQCPPGGAQGIARLARITGQAEIALNPLHGHEGPRQVASIDEAWCIGCTLCLKACPVDCIVGGPKQMHTVIASLCTGCELCLPVCPVDCIVLENASGELTGWDAWSARQAGEARERYAARNVRLDRAERETAERRAAKSAPPPAEEASQPSKRAMIDAAIARARAQRSG